MKDLRVKPERLVGDDEDGVDGPPTEGVHESVEVAIDVALAAAVDRERGDTVSQPFYNFVVPILKNSNYPCKCRRYKLI